MVNLIQPGTFFSTVFADRTFQNRLFCEYGLSAPETPTVYANPLRTLISQLESKSYGTYCFEPGCVEPGIDNIDTPLRKIIANLESKSYGDYSFEPGCVEPGVDNVNTPLRRLIEKLKRQE